MGLDKSWWRAEILLNTLSALYDVGYLHKQGMITDVYGDV